MTKENQVDIKQVYKEYAEKGLDSAQQLGWNDLVTQAQYMTLMVELVDSHFDLKGKTIHDAGCGYGDLIGYLEKAVGNNLISSYMGTDLMEASIEEAKKRRPAYHFFQRDLLVDEVPKADITICMGALAFHESAKGMALLERLWEASSTALAFNSWWNLTPAYVGYWNSQKLQKRIQMWLKNKKHVRLKHYDPTERMFLVLKG